MLKRVMVVWRVKDRTRRRKEKGKGKDKTYRHSLNSIDLMLSMLEASIYRVFRLVRSHPIQHLVILVHAGFHITEP